MDIVFGDSSSYFGILIRTIKSLKTGEIIEGPCRCVNTILGLYGCDNLNDLLKSDEHLNIYNNRLNLCLVRVDEMNNGEMLYGPRIGLSDKYPEFKNRQYRFVIKNTAKKEKKTLVSIM